MNRRLLLSYASLIVLVLVVLEVPLAIYYGRNERTWLADRVERDAVALSSLAEGALERPREIPATSLEPFVLRYRRETGGRVVVVNRGGRAVADSSGGPPGRSFATRPEVAQALKGRVVRGVRYSHTLGTNLLYVAVPVASSGAVHGAVRITYPTSAVDARVHRYWLILTGIGALVFVFALVLALTLARWISRPLRAVEEAAVAAGDGDLTARAPTEEGPPEVRALAVAINDTVSKLERLLRSQEEFVADASHQLRTPLTALRLRLENLEHEASPDALAGALREVDRLSRLVDALLALARADASEPRREAVGLRALAERRVEAWDDLAAERDVSLRVDMNEELAVRAAPARLEQVLDNLLSNALDVAPPGSAVILGAAETDGGVELHVVDEGRGMREAERRRAFDRFWRGGTSGTGSGLGLAIVKRLVASDGGEVELREAPDGGVDAVVRLRPARPTGAVPILAGSRLDREH